MKTKFFTLLLSFYLALCAGFVSAAEVLLGPSDVVKVLVYGHADLALETRISETGSITFPLIGEVSVGGLSTSAAEKKVAKLLEQGGFIKNPQVNIIVTLLQSQLVSVLGQVAKPGRYPIDGKRRLTDILALAGGVLTDGADSVILLRVKEGVSKKEIIDLVDVMRDGDAKKNVELIGNDVIYVERAPRFYIYGEVQRAGAYRLERDMTVLQALSSSGGLSARGTERGIRIKRRNAAGALEIIQAKHDDLLRADDVVYVQESLF